MNNKYDVKNFSDLIDNYNTEKEMMAIDADIQAKMIATKGERRPTIFDPEINQDYLENSKYEFKAYLPKRYDLNSISKESKLI